MLEPNFILYAVTQAESLATVSDESGAVEVGYEVEGIADWGFQERKNVLFHG